MRTREILTISLLSLVLAGCSARLARDDAREKIIDLGAAALVPKAVEIRRIVSESNDRAIVEAGVTLAFEFARDGKKGDWEIVSVRLGDGQWIDVQTLVAAVNVERQRQTAGALEKLSRGIQEYRKQHGSVPNVENIVALTDILHPRFSPDLIRNDAWGHQIEYQVLGGNSFRLRSAGADGRPNTSDDIVVEDGQLLARP